ncbi:HupE/UreJ family protein [Acetobacteraceae bacterium H6797]|nr:HupE/UreJ family protein [Acetobacteraceae bacterium H6797]
MRRLPLLAGLAAAALLLAPGAEAHQIGAEHAGFAAGIAHPFSGLDHLLAMLALGIWAALIGGRAALALPLAFPAAMIVGGVLGAAGVGLPFVEPGIALSVVALGGLVALGARPPLGAALALVAVFAALHGHAHGTELPEAASPVAYGLGVVLATLALHAMGFGLGRLAMAARQPAFLKAGGLGVSLAGVVLLLG